MVQDILMWRTQVFLGTIASTSRLMQLWDKYVATGTDAPPADAPSPARSGTKDTERKDTFRKDAALTIHTVCLGCRV